MTVEELKKYLSKLGFPKSTLNKLKKDQLMELHEKAMEDQTVLDLDDFEEIPESLSVEIEDSEEEELENINFYNINKLDVEIIQEQSNSVTLGQIMETSAETEGDIQMSDINQNPPQQNSEDFIQEFQQEAGTLRQKDA